MSELTITVYGDPAPQGSKTAFRNQYTGRIQQVESSPRIGRWRHDVRTAVEDVMKAEAGHAWQVTNAPVGISIEFAYLRPSSHWRTGRNSHRLRDTAPAYPIAKNKNDIDKLVRAVLDAIGSTGLVWGDDSQVVKLHGVWKRYCDHPAALDRPGALIRIWTEGGQQLTSESPVTLRQAITEFMDRLSGVVPPYYRDRIYAALEEAPD